MEDSERDGAERGGGKDDFRRGTDEIVEGVGDLVSATLDLVGRLARRTASLTAKDPTVPRAPDRTSPVNVIVHYGMVTVSNLLEALTDATDAAIRTARPDAAAPPERHAGRQGGQPTVRAGERLRMPLSIENTTEEPMTDLDLRCVELRFDGRVGHGVPLTEQAVRFEPARVTIAPRDFEKVTVFIDTPPETACGRYEALLALGSDEHRSAVAFRVVE